MASDVPDFWEGIVLIGPVFPRFCVDLSPNLQLPSLFRGRIGFTRVSCGTGFDRHSLDRSAGEALERQFSFAELREGTSVGCLKKLPDKTANWFRAVFCDADQQDLEDQQFSLAEMLDRSSGEIIEAPVIPHTLGKHPDDRFMPIRDSSGCAFHTNASRAESGARIELYERQALTCFWYFGHVNFALEVDKNSTLEFKSSIRGMLALLRLKGRILLYDISLVRPHRVVLAAFVSDGDKVKFSSGAGAAQTFADAALKAILELYQAFVLMDQLVDVTHRYRYSDEFSDEISKGYLASNTVEKSAVFIEIFDKHKVPAPDVGIQINWRGNLKEQRELVQLRSLKFGGKGPELWFCSIHLVGGFPTMAPTEIYPTSTSIAAENYGYSQPLRAGPIPFG